jgi:hypothetical protein
MEAPLSICTKEETRGVIRFLLVEIIRRMQAEYCDNCLSRSKIYEWIDHFRKGKNFCVRWGEIRKAVNVKDWEQYSNRWKNGTGKHTNHSGRQWGGFHMSGPMKGALTGRRFSSDEEVTGAVQNWFKTQQKNSFSDGIKKLVKCWNRCVEVEGDYVEK